VYAYAPPRDDDLRVVRSESGGWEVLGRHPLRMVIMTAMNNEEAVAHLQYRLRKAGVEEALVRAGAVEGDAVTIGPVTFDFDPEV
jgi:GTP-binding protein